MPPSPVHLLALPTPFAVGEVNAYLVDDDPLTLVDTGPDCGTTLVALQRALGEHGRRIADLERIVLTHQHIDHIGLAQILAERSGAEVVCLAALAPWLADYDARMEDEDAFAEALMIRHGIPQEIALALRAVTGQTRAWGNRVEVSRPLSDGESLQFADRSWRVHHRPGHSPSDTVFHDERTGELLVGDHLIRHISSNAIVSRPLDGDDGMPVRPLRIYLESLRATRELAADVVLPGHGVPIDDHRALIDRRLAGHERRLGQITRVLRGGARTIFEIAQEIWGTVAVTQAFLTFSEVFGHLDLLCERGEAIVLDADEPVRYALAS